MIEWVWWFFKQMGKAVFLVVLGIFTWTVITGIAKLMPPF